MSKVLLASLFLVCCISQNYALKCYQCTDCENGRVDEQMCPAGLVCGKLAINVDIQNQHKSIVTKSCLPEIRGDCKSFIHTTLRDSGVFTGQGLSSIDQVMNQQGVNLECASCSTDLCNSSNVIYPSILTFALILVLSRLC